VAHIAELAAGFEKVVAVDANWGMGLEKGISVRPDAG